VILGCFQDAPFLSSLSFSFSYLANLGSLAATGSMLPGAVRSVTVSGLRPLFEANDPEATAANQELDAFLSLLDSAENLERVCFDGVDLKA